MSNRDPESDSQQEAADRVVERNEGRSLSSMALRRMDEDSDSRPARLERDLGLGGVLATVLGVSLPAPMIGPYTLIRKVGQGGMGHVFLAADSAGRSVALKVLRRVDAAVRARFGREVALLQRVDHPGVVKIISHGWDAEGEPFLAMEWLEGRDLGETLALRAATVDEVLRLGVAVASSLAAAHDVGVLHRDIKPSNLFLEGGNFARPKLIDFGLARRFDAHGQSRLTATGALVGTPAYLAPELFSQDGDVRADVYGLGATLFEVLARRPPFGGGTPGGVFAQVLQQPAPELLSLGIEVPGPLNALIARMLAKNPEVRPRDMRTVALALSELREELAAIARSKEVVDEATRGWMSESVSRESGSRFVPIRFSEASTDRSARAQREGHFESDPQSEGPAKEEPWPFLGRERELGFLAALRVATTQDRVARCVHVVGEQGVGKTRLVAELGSRWRPIQIGTTEHSVRAETVAPQDADTSASSIVRVACSPREQGEPFSLLRRILDVAVEFARTASFFECVTTAEALLDELTRIALGAPQACSPDMLRLRWLECVRQLFPLMTTCVVDDAHLADDVSMRFLAAAFSELDDRPWLLILLSRDGGEAKSVLDRWGRPIDETLEIRPLARRWMRLLAERLTRDRPRVPAARLALVMQGGVPGALGALGRFKERSLDLSGLEPAARRALGIAAILGTTVARAELLALMRERSTDADSWLDDLERRGFLQREPGRSSESSCLCFADSTTQAAVLDTLSDEETRSYNLAVAEKLSAEHPPPFARLAAHYRAAGADTLAAAALLAVARLLAAAERHLDALETVRDALALTPTLEVRRDLEQLQADAAMWSGDVDRALELFEAIAIRSEAGSAREYRAMSGAIHCLGQLGDNHAIAGVEARALSAQPVDREARDEQIIVVCRAHNQIVASETLPFAPLGLVEVELGRDSRGQRAGHEAQGWLWRVRSLDLAMTALGPSIDAAISSHHEFRLAQNHRLAVLGQIQSASLSIWSGDFAAAEASTAPIAALSQRLGAPFLALWARYTDAKRLCEVGEIAEAAAELRSILPSLDRVPRMAAGALVYEGTALLEAGDLGAARAVLELALERHSSASTRAAALAGLARLEALEGHAPAALALVREARGIAKVRGHLLEFGSWVLYEAASLELAHGEAREGEAALAEADALLAGHASSFATPFRATMYLTGTRVNRRIAELRSGLETNAAAPIS